MSKIRVKLKIISFMFIFLMIGFGYQNSQAIPDSSVKVSGKKLSIQANTPVPIPTRDELHHYNISVDYSPSAHSTTGWTNISFLNKEAITLTDLKLHLWGNDVVADSIIIHNIYNETNLPLIYVISTDNKLTITTAPILQNERYIVNINFTVNLPNIPSRFGYTNENYLTHAFGNWYPILAVRENGDWNSNLYAEGGEAFYSEMSYIDVNITFDNSEVIAGAGDLQGVTVNGDEYTYHYTAGPVRDFAWMASLNYTVYSELYNGVNITSFYYPEHTERGILAVDVTKKSLDLFSDLFEPYPYNSMSIGAIADAWFGGMEYNQLVMINDINYNKLERGYDRFEDVISHEWAHTWNTYLTGNNPYIDPWLDESWAMFSSSLYFEEYYGIDWYNGRHHFLKQNYLDFVATGNDHYLDDGWAYWDNYPGAYEVLYVKGMIVMDMLRYVLGDADFFGAILDFYDTYSYATVTTEDFIEIFNYHADDDITWFFDQFLYDTTVLDYDITSATMYKNDSSNKWDITIGIISYHSGVSPPKMKVPLRIQASTESFFDIMISETFNVVNVSVPQSFGTPTLVNLDPDWIMLREQRSLHSTIKETDTPGEVTATSILISSSIASSTSTSSTPTVSISLSIIFILLGIGGFVLKRKKGRK